MKDIFLELLTKDIIEIYVQNFSRVFMNNNAGHFLRKLLSWHVFGGNTCYNDFLFLLSITASQVI